MKLVELKGKLLTFLLSFFSPKMATVNKCRVFIASVERDLLRCIQTLMPEIDVDDLKYDIKSKLSNVIL